MVRLAFSLPLLASSAAASSTRLLRIESTNFMERNLRKVSIAEESLMRSLQQVDMSMSMSMPDSFGADGMSMSMSMPDSFGADGMSMSMDMDMNMDMDGDDGDDGSDSGAPDGSNGSGDDAASGSDGTTTNDDGTDTTDGTDNSDGTDGIDETENNDGVDVDPNSGDSDITCDRTPGSLFSVQLNVDLATGTDELPQEQFDSALMEAISGNIPACGTTRRRLRRLQEEVTVGQLSTTESSTLECQPTTEGAGSCSVVDLVIPVFGDFEEAETLIFSSLRDSFEEGSDFMTRAITFNVLGVSIVSEGADADADTDTTVASEVEPTEDVDGQPTGQEEGEPTTARGDPADEGESASSNRTTIVAASCAAIAGAVIIALVVRRSTLKRTTHQKLDDDGSDIFTSPGTV